jgi:ATP-binding cassette, subfamily B, bacterial IrtA/YbtP
MQIDSKVKQAANSTRKQGFSRLVQIAGTRKWWLFASMTLAVLATAAQFVPMAAVYLIIQELAARINNTGNIDKDLLYRLGCISLASVGVYGALLYSSLMLSHIAAFNILYEIRVQIARKLTRLSMGFFSGTASGEIKKIMSEDVERIELFVAHHIPDITSAIVFPLGIIVYLLSMDWRLALAALIPLPLSVGMMAAMMGSDKSKQSYREYHSALEKLNAAVVEYVRGMPVVKIFGTSLNSFRRLKESVTGYSRWSKAMTKDYSKAYPAFLTIASSSLIFIIPAATVLLQLAENSVILVPRILFFLIIGGGFFFPLLKLMFMTGFLNQITIGLERIDGILYREELQEPKKEASPQDTSLEFDSVCFAYNRTPVLSGVSFRAEPGTVTALVGPSGAGKTTAGLLAARFWDIDSGAIRLGGVDIRNMNASSLMDKVSFVFQDNFLFFDTIEENIRMGNSTAPMKSVIEAAKAACCHEFIESLPKGYKTLVGEGGTYLSGGEQQRVSIARAILKDSPVVILDEATAYADPENEGKIIQGISRLIRNKTVLVIAHRLSTITTADQILVIDNGCVVQAGNHYELAAEPGLYKHMWETYSRAREWKIAPKSGVEA